MVLADYTHLLNYITWFNEATIQSKLNNDFGGNLSSSEVVEKTNPDKLENLRDELVATFNYMFNKSSVTSSTVKKVDADDVTIAATWGGVSKDLININTSGSAQAFNIWKQRAWTNVHETGLFANTFTFAEFVGTEEVPHIGIAVSMLDVVIIVIIQTSVDNSVPPRPRPSNPSDPSDDRGNCTDGLDIEICDEEEDDDDCEPIEYGCISDFKAAC